MSGHDHGAADDQLAAAMAQIHDGLDALVLDRGYVPGTAREDPWLEGLVLDAIGARGAPPQLCPHVAAMRGPQPVYLSATTGRISCAPCQRADLVAIQATDEDLTCDRCRTIPADGRLALTAMNLGPVIVPMGLCQACLPAIHAEAT